MCWVWLFYTVSNGVHLFFGLHQSFRLYVTQHYIIHHITFHTVEYITHNRCQHHCPHRGSLHYHHHCVQSAGATAATKARSKNTGALAWQLECRSRRTTDAALWTQESLSPLPPSPELGAATSRALEANMATIALYRTLEPRAVVSAAALELPAGAQELPQPCPECGSQHGHP